MSTFYQKFHNLYEDTVYICPPEVQCDVMYKGSMKILFKKSLQITIQITKFKIKRLLLYFSRIVPAYYCKCCNLIVYCTRYLFNN